MPVRVQQSTVNAPNEYTRTEEPNARSQILSTNVSTVNLPKEEVWDFETIDPSFLNLSYGR